MSNTQIKIEMREKESNIIKKYSLLAKLFLIITFILIIWVVAVYLGTLLFSYGYDWAGLSLDLWIIVLCAIIGVFILFDLLFYLHFLSVKNRRVEIEKPKPEYMNGKKVHIYTFPEGMEGGIFSKTYVQIDEHNILRLRSLMIPPNELWNKSNEE